MVASPAKNDLKKTFFTLDDSESISTVMAAPINITNNTSVTSTFSVMLMDDVLDGGLTGTTITDDHVGKTWIVQSSSATTSGSGIDLELTWDASDEVGTLSSYDVVYFDESTSEWKALSGTMGSVLTSGTTKTVSISNVTTDFTDPVMLAVAPSPGAVPTITSFSPVSVSAGGTVTLVGTEFGTNQSDISVFVGGIEATVTSITNTQIEFTVPDQGRTGLISVVRTDLGTAGMSNAQISVSPNFTGSLPAWNYSCNKGTEFTLTSSNPSWSASPKDMGELADFDGDGDLDIAVINYGGASVDIFENTSSNGVVSSASDFTKTSFTTMANPRNIVIVDINNDGKLDIAVADASSTVSILINNSSSGLSFLTKQDFTMSGASYIEAGDIDGDGDFDLVLNAKGGNSIYIYPNQSSGNTAAFGSVVTVTGASTIYDVQIGDMNGDHKPDLVLGNSTNVTLFENTSSGSISFATPVAFGTGSTTNSVGIADLNGDGMLDVVAGLQSTTSGKVFENTHTSGAISSSTLGTAVTINSLNGSSANRSWHVDFADIDGNGKLDIINVDFNAGSRMIVAFNSDSDGSLATSDFTSTYITGGSSYGQGVGADLNSDGLSDFVYFTSGYVKVTLNRYGATPTYSVSANSFDPFLSCSYGAASTAQSFTVTGSNLIDDIRVRRPTRFEISLDGITWSTSTLVLPQTNGEINQTVYLRYKPSYSTNYNTNLSIIPDYNSCWSLTTTTIPVSGVSTTAPTISTQPVDKDLCLNDAATISATITSSSLTYQWYSNTTNSNTGGTSLGSADGAQTATYTVPTSSTSTNYYYLEAQNGCGSVVTDAAEVAVSPAPVAGSISATTNNACYGDNVTYSISGNTGDIQWQSSSDGTNWSDISGETSTTYTLIATENTNIRAAVSSGSCTPLNTNSEALTVPAAPRLFSQDLSFDGVDDKVSVPHTTDHNFTTGYTLEAWIKVNSNLTWSNQRLGVVTKTQWSFAGLGYGLDIEYGKPRIFGGQGYSNWGGAQSTTNLAIGQWVHLAGTYDGTAFKLYVDGQLVKTQNSTTGFSSNTRPLTIGSWPAENKFFDGEIDEVRVWNIARTQAEIQSTMNQELTGNETSLVSYYNFNEGNPSLTNTSVTTLPDVTSGSNDGTLSGFALSGTSSNWVASGPMIIGESEVCEGSTMTLTHTESGGTWSSSDASVISITSAGEITGVAAGIATISYDYTFNGCNYTSTKAITVNALPVVPVVSDLDVCNGEVVDLSTVSTALAGHTLSWSIGGNAASTTVPNFTSSTAGQTTYSVYQTNDATGCVSPASTQVVTENALPAAPTVTDVEVCEGDFVDLSNTVTTLSGHTANWSATAIENTSAPVGQTLSTGNYTIGQSFTPSAQMSLSALSFYAYNANSAATLTMTLYQGDGYSGNVLATETLSGTSPGEIKFDLSTPVTLTANQIYTFKIETNTSGSHSINWNSGGNPYPGGAYWRYGSKFSTSDIWFKVYSNTTTAPNYTSISTGTSVYSVYQTNTTTGCVSSAATQTVTVNALPVISGLTSVNAGEDVTLSATTTGATSNAWVSSDNTVATVSSTGVVTGQAPGNATITYTNSNGCTDDYAMTVNVGTTQVPTLTSPASNITGATMFAVTYSLPETPLSGSVKLTFSPTDGSTPIVWTMSDATSVNFNYDVNTTPSNAAVVSGALIAYDTYDVELSYQDAFTNPAATVTNTNIQTLAPPVISYAPSSYAYLTNAAITAITPSNTGGAVSSYAIVGTLPTGLSFSTTTGQVTGTPTALKALTTYSVTATNASGSSTTTVEIVVDNDTDGDGIPDASDVDVDGDGVPDNGTDTDGDGVNNDFDDDIDGDGIPNDQDNDIDGDGIPNGSDVDINGDGTPDNGTDTDGDGVNDANDPDIDGDGIPNGSDNCPTVINTDITVQPSTQSEDICPSLTLTDLEVTAVGENLTYQWYSNSTSSNTGGTAVAGATNATFTPPSLVGPTYYYVVVSGDCGTETSAVSGALYVRDIINPTVTALTGFTVQLDANGSYTVTESDIITSKSDNCTITPVITLANNTFTCSDLTATGLAVSWTATDDEGNTTTGTVPVTVVDQIAPTMAVQNVSVQMDASGNSSVTVSQVDNGTTDNCAATLSFDAAGTITTTNYTASDLGSNNVTLYGTDASGNQSSLGAVVTVVDQISPVVNTQNVTVYLDANGAASITTADIDNGTTDNSGVFTLSLDVTSFDCDDLGTNTVVLTATDGSGNISNANATVTVVDNTTPVMNITNSYAQLGSDGTVTLTQSDISGTVVDNCDVTWTFSTATFDCTMLGANIITVTATDASGNSATDEIVVTIVDNSAPVVATQSASLVLDANGTATLDTADVIDYIRENCSISTITVSQTSFNCSDLGANVVTLLVLDSEGNSTAQTATVTVTDATAPTAVAQDITVSLDANGAASISYLDVEDGSSDNCSVDSYSIDVASFTCLDLGANWVVLTVADASGNTDTAWAKVTVEDNLAPTALVQPVTVALDANGAATVSASDVDAGSYDNCSGVTTSIDVTSFTCADLGANTVTLTATDAAGNTTSVATTVTVVDNLAPVVATQSASLVLDANGTATLDTADVIDYVRENCSVASITLSETSFGCSDLGSNTVTLTVVDSEGNSTAMNATVTVADNDAPTILTPSMVTVYSNALCQATATWTTTVMDNCSATWTSNYVSGSTFGVGQHDVITTATDAAGNVTVDTMMVSVIDTVAPTFTQMPFVLSMTPGAGCGAYVTWVAPMAVDWCSNISITANVLNGSLFTSGTHTVVFTATDDNQNTRSTTLTFTVNDGVAPVVNVPATVTAVNDPGLCGANVVLPTPTATDNCGVDTVYYSVPSGSFFNVGVTAVTVTAVDYDGNTDQGTFNVVVQDTEAPSFVSVPSDTTLGYCNNGFAYATPTASDNCSIASVSLISGIASGNTFPVGTTKNVFEVVDIHGNSDTVSFDVTVSAQIAAPVPAYGPICANDASFDLRMGDTTFVFWGDDVDDNFFNPFSAGPGNSVVYYSWTDSLGCSSTYQMNLFVEQAPDRPVVQRFTSTHLTVHKAYAQYQWYYNGSPINGATSRNLSATAGGNYKVKVWNAAGCEEISNPFMVGTIGLDEAAMESIVLYPNPTSGAFTIDLTTINEEVTVVIYNGIGKVVFTGAAKSEKLNIDLSDKAAGMYQVVLRGEDGASLVKRVSIQK